MLISLGLYGFNKSHQILIINNLVNYSIKFLMDHSHFLNEKHWKRNAENQNLYKLVNHSKHGNDFAFWYSRQLLFTHSDRFSLNPSKLPRFLRPQKNDIEYTYENPLVIKKVYLDTQIINEGIQWYYCGSVHQQLVNGFFGGLFSGVYNKLFTSWPMTNVIHPPKIIPDGMTPDDYPTRQLSQWTVNGIVRAFRVCTVSIAAAFIYDMSEQFCKQFRNKEDSLNPVFAGAFTGSIIGLRRGIMRASSTSLLFAVFAVSYDKIDQLNSNLNPKSFPNRNSPFFF